MKSVLFLYLGYFIFMEKRIPERKDIDTSVKYVSYLQIVISTRDVAECLSSPPTIAYLQKRSSFVYWIYQVMIYSLFTSVVIRNKSRDEV
jgi:hypothetical protein